MILGIGNDIIEIERIKNSIFRHGARFLEKIFTEKERSYCLKYKDSHRHFAGRFAAKEAIVKALGTGISKGLSWLDIEITNDEHGKPLASLSPDVAISFNYPQVLISISHSREYATAFCIINKSIVCN
jgi:holo-[acyl-carrier protein] synthase